MLWIGRSVAILAALAGLLVLVGQMGLLSGNRPADLGVRDGRLKPAPTTPNCVSSQAEGGYHAIAPLAITGDAASEFARLQGIVESMPGARLVRADTDYFYAEFASRLLGFVDDVEFYLDRPAGVIHVRSASRLGHSDLGANRKRVEAIRARFSGG